MLCVYLSYPNLFPSQINIISSKNPAVMPPLLRRHEQRRSKMIVDFPYKLS